MRIGEAYFNTDFEDGPMDGLYGPAVWMVCVLTQIGSEKVAYDIYLGGPSIPWSYEGESSMSRALFSHGTPMTELEKRQYKWVGNIQEEQHRERTGKKRNSAIGRTGVILGVGGIVFAFMMMR